VNNKLNDYYKREMNIDKEKWNESILIRFESSNIQNVNLLMWKVIWLRTIVYWFQNMY
jgi:hypothetical protein